MERDAVADEQLVVLAHIEAELADVERALERLDDASYGTCEICGRPVGDERLEDRPAARHCGDHVAAAVPARLEQPR